MEQNIILQDLIKTRNALKRKFNTLKQDKTESNIMLTETFKPITEPLQELIKIKSETKANNFNDIKIKKENNESKMFTSTPIKKINFTPGKHSNENITHNSDVSFSTHTPKKHKSMTQHQSFGDSNSTIKNINQDDELVSLMNNASFDTVFGPHINKKTNTLKLGNKDLHLVNDKLKIGNLSFDSTPGMLNLIFQKKPNKYTKYDLDAYNEIIQYSGINKDGNDIGMKTRTNHKYNVFIKKTLKTGKGLLNKVSNRKIEYIYFDDYNELVERLKLIIAAKNAGNNNMDNEINSIIEELKEANIIV